MKQEGDKELLQCGFNVKVRSQGEHNEQRNDEPAVMQANRGAQLDLRLHVSSDLYSHRIGRNQSNHTADWSLVARSWIFQLTIQYIA
jgi:hypothetical protein